MGYSNRSSVSYNRSSMSYNRSSRMSSMSGVFNNSVESVVRISSVVNSSGGAVRLGQTVVSLNSVTFTLFRLFLYVTGVGIVNSVIVLVMSRSLEIKK